MNDQEILFHIKPDFIIECGTKEGGSALFFAHMCDLLQKGRVITIDIEQSANRPSHNRITYLHGNSISDAIYHTVSALIQPTDTVIVILDSDHSEPHVYKEME